MALNTSKCNHLPPLPFKGLTLASANKHPPSSVNCSLLRLVCRCVPVLSLFALTTQRSRINVLFVILCLMESNVQTDFMFLSVKY